jgi:two-component system, chemotaxis family, chemotaxis protein CheY
MAGLEALRVLVVDDNAQMRTLLVTMLEGFGVRTVKEVRDGSDALEALRQWQPDLAIVDHMMEPIDGITFTRLVRTSPDSPAPYLPIIMLAGHSDLARVREARDAGINEFIVKPLSAKALVDRINAVIFRQRPFVRTPGYFGPDRRRRQDPYHNGPWRRAGERGPPGV